MLNTIFNRRSVRKYIDKPVEKEKIEEILKAGMYAPSACNKQPWHFIVCGERHVIDEIRKIHPYSAMLKEAPLCIIVCGDTELEMVPKMYTVDCSAATQNILLAAKSLDLDSCWLGVYLNNAVGEELSKYFKLPENIKPFSVIALGYSNENIAHPDRFRPERIHYNNW